MDLLKYIDNKDISDNIKNISKKIIENKRISKDECKTLYNEAELGLLGMLANFVREQKNGKKTYYNKNIHIEPTNICIYNCKFCSYSKKIGGEGWELNLEQIIEKIKKAPEDITEVHIVGGVHPFRDIYYYSEIIKEIKLRFPKLHIKAFTAVEIDYMIKKSKLSLEEGILILKKSGLDSVPGGGAEIFDKEIRNKICPTKTTTEQWLNIHKTLHNNGIPSNSTMLYGHIESIDHRIAHLELLRNLQDETKGFLAFIPLKYKNKNNEMSDIKEVSVVEDMRNYSISRIFLDNFPHIKAYWPMLGKETAQISLQFGVDDFDGTINDSTKIYSLAGSSEEKPSMTSDEIRQLITEAGKIPIERDSLYNELNH
jgi:aminodeoxyfutalosine synthase